MDDTDWDKHDDLFYDVRNFQICLIDQKLTLIINNPNEKFD